ncbi:MAG: hypothetical protein A3D44_03510 [Candidatus Staskawiczbacteria bacterium RIFCSPHIGHO2_02_FULL_42_22]|uniref:Uncharacterized protein n=1 Tax=Candidatus Staskawiczbacteria bacterium RIFCSPHIGHO2_02_FULL_42_22 TaxID=1802207 RepID=A0A1G2I3R1_9BACT|nr:MAG: hypothetical protein A3D44_03510 [Candidatus Staskawiczbacteria bacterium RIFCSPHIGHO2_02_FULL_42_22]
METIRFFTDPNIRASVSLANKIETYLEVSDQGIISVPRGVNPTGFYLAVLLPKHGRTVVVQKNVGQEKGGYSKNALTDFPDLVDRYDLCMMHDPIQVKRAGKNVWTNWHSDNPNRLDCWHLDHDGSIRLFQVGIITHDDGKTWRLHGEYRWKGKLFQDGVRVVGRPKDHTWGSFESRKMILEVPDFQQLMQDAELQPWRRVAEELDPPLPVPDRGFAVVDWYTCFGGQTGQGIVKLHDGSSTWVHGIDVMEPPDAEGIVQLHRGDVISYFEAVSFGKKHGSPPKIVNVSKVS